MKKLLICLTILAIVACKQEPKIDYVVLSGKLENTKINKAILKGVAFEQEISIAEDGTFLDTLKVIENGFYTISIGREKTAVYLKQGDNVTLNKNKSGFYFEGPTASVNNYFKAKNENSTALIGNPKALYSLEVADFKEKANALMNANKETVNKIEGADKDFITAELKNIQFDYYSKLNDYERAHAYYTKKKDFKVSEDFMPAELKNMSFNNAVDYKNSTAYQQLAFGSIMSPIFEAVDDINDLKVSDLESVSAIKIPALKNEVIGYLSKMALSPSNTNLDSMYAFFKDNTTDSKIKESIEEGYNKAKVLAIGRPSPTFDNYENYKGGTTSLSDLKGKYVYVDIWATWCGPCLKEIPSLKKVEKQYHGKNIEFVSLSVDNGRGFKAPTKEESAILAHEGWKKMIADKGLGGIQLYSDKNWQSSFVQAYGVNSIPRFILIDPEGNIVSGDAPRPSSPKLIELFNSLSI